MLTCHLLPSCQNGSSGLSSRSPRLRAPLSLRFALHRSLPPFYWFIPCDFQTRSSISHVASVTPDPRFPFYLTGSVWTSLKIPLTQQTGPLNFITTPPSHALCLMPHLAFHMLVNGTTSHGSSSREPWNSFPPSPGVSNPPASPVNAVSKSISNPSTSPRPHCHHLNPGHHQLLPA